MTAVSADLTGLGWPETAAEVADEDVSRETPGEPAGLGWPA
jgi:hypothetical protein